MNLPPRSLFRHPERRRAAPKSKDPVQLQERIAPDLQLPPTGTHEGAIYTSRHPERSAGGKADGTKSKDPVDCLGASAPHVSLPPTGTGEFWIYILTNDRRTVLYIGVTNELAKRLGEHVSGNGSEFTRKYNISRLIYYENFPDATQAIAREKQLKGWTRAKKVALINKVNPDFADLAPMLFGVGWREEVLKESATSIPRGPSTSRLVPRRSAQDDGNCARPVHDQERNAANGEPHASAGERPIYTSRHPERSAGGKAGGTKSKDPVDSADANTPTVLDGDRNQPGSNTGSSSRSRRRFPGFGPPQLRAVDRKRRCSRQNTAGQLLPAQ